MQVYGTADLVNEWEMDEDATIKREIARIEVY